MATSMVGPLTVANSKAVASGSSLPKSSFLSNSEGSFFSPRGRKVGDRKCFKFSIKASIKNIPKEFRLENLSDRLAENYKNVPKSLYGLSPSQMNMFMANDDYLRPMSEATDPESLSYLGRRGKNSLSSVDSDWHQHISMRENNISRGLSDKEKRILAGQPPDLISWLLDNRVIWLDGPIVPEITQLIISQFMWLSTRDRKASVYFYINSRGILNAAGEVVGDESDIFAIVDAMRFCKGKVYTVCQELAVGGASLLLSLGHKGERRIQAISKVSLSLPKSPQSSGPTTDMWTHAKQMDWKTGTFLKLLSEGTGKTKEELHEAIKKGRIFNPETAIEFGLVDKITDINENMKIYMEREKKKEKARRFATNPW